MRGASVHCTNRTMIDRSGLQHWLTAGVCSHCEQGIRQFCIVCTIWPNQVLALSISRSHIEVLQV